MPLQEDLNHRLTTLSEQGRLRNLPEQFRGLDFSHNDYLGFSKRPELLKKAKEFADLFGTGATASRLISGNQESHKILEKKITQWKNCEASLLFTSGYVANVGVLSSIAEKNDLFVLDKLSHASIVDGVKLSGVNYRSFKHKNYDELEKLLIDKRESFRNVFILSDSVFSMDGTLADLKRLVEIKKKFNCYLYLDEAHATGVFGYHGQGLAHLCGVEDEVDISVGTLSKALGSQGGFACGSQQLISYLVNSSRGFIYSTGLNAFSCGAALAAIELLESSDLDIKRLWENKNYFESLSSILSDSPIIPMIIGDEEKALAASESLLQKGFYVKAVRPPTVPVNTSRLRIMISAAHEKVEIEALAHTLQTCLENI